MSLKPWREIATPHKDVLEGSFKQSEFAADITQVATGEAPPEYQDAEKFFSRTFITEGMRLLLVSVAQRIAAQGGDPVIQLQTAFGGGKTHTLLAVYHFARYQGDKSQLFGITAVLKEAGIKELPAARMAIVDGIRYSPSQAREYGDTSVNTLWGDLAWQLLGEEGYQFLAQSDAEGTSPGKETLIKLLKQAAPCVILMDELVAFLRQLEPGQRYKAGTFDSNISFVQALTEALKAVPNAILLASLPESQLEVGGAMGQQALASLEKFFARVESVWKPVAAEEAFEIVRRRLFENPGETAEVEGISRQFSDFYRKHAEKFPLETQSNDYYERLCRAYPIHPEIFDRLYEDWSTLDKFQRTRGVLQYLAIVIHRLWNSDNRDALIMPGSIPLEDSNVRNKSIHYLPQGWEPVIEREVDGPRSAPYDIDGHQSLFGSVQAARRTARTIFLGSAPSGQAQAVRGIEQERILLGAVQPEQTVGVFEDVLKRLRDRLHYLYSDKDRFWLDTKPNLRREMESRKQGINESDELIPLLRERVNRVLGRDHQFGGVHVFTPSVDIPDDYGNGPKLVVLNPDASYSRSADNPAIQAAREIVENRGDQPRQKQNRLIFLVADQDMMGRLKELGRTFLAWESIVEDIEKGNLNHDISHLNQAKRSQESSNSSLTQLIRETYKWLLAPAMSNEKEQKNLHWEAVQVSPSSPNLIKAIEQKLREEEWLIYEWAPIHLTNVLATWYFKNGVQEVNALKVWQDCCAYLFLPRLVNDSVFRMAIAQGVESKDYFGYASGKNGDDYLGFSFGHSAVAPLDESALLIERDAALTYSEAIQAKEAAEKKEREGQESSTDSGHSENKNTKNESAGNQNEAKDSSKNKTIKTQFYGTVALDPIKAKMDFATIMDEIVQQFTTNYGIDVKISVEIEAKNAKGFDDNLQRTIKENCNVLKFGSSEFEDE